MRSKIKAGEFYHSKHFRAVAKVIEIERLWGHDYVRIWLPNADALVRVPVADLSPINSQSSALSSDHIAYVAAAAKVANVLEGPVSTNDGHVLLAPMESNVIPLPHQIHALSRAISGSRVRYLLADEVGLGKTVEAGLILRELKLRGLVRRSLVVAPKGLATQWVAEMQIHFNEQFQLVLGDDFGTLKRLASGNDRRNSVWTMFDQVIVSFDSVKPMTGRRGWTDERVHEYNRDRFEDLITAGWDLVIVDEGHRLGGSSDQVARYKLGRGLAEAAPYMLLLSATPHQGKTDAFHRLMNLLDDEAFPDTEGMSRDRVAPYIIRTEKRKAIDTDGNPLFQSRRTQMAPVAWESRHQLQKLPYEAVTDYVCEGYNQALREKKRHIGFLMILMQRLVVSSTRAIRTTLERRLAALQLGEQQASMRLTVDKIMHGMQLGAAGMHNQIRQWCQRGFLAELIGYLLDSGYEVWLTSDHGNIECKGKGRPSEGVIAETQGERVRVYPTPELRSQIAGRFPCTLDWQPAGLPPDYFPLFAGGRNAFVNPGNTIVGHGGLSIEEVIVPLVKCERGAR